MREAKDKAEDRTRAWISIPAGHQLDPPGDSFSYKLVWAEGTSLH